MAPRTTVLKESNYFKYLSERQAESKRRLPPQIAHLFTIQQRCKLFGPQTYEEICIRGLTLFLTHSKKKRGILGMLGPLDLLLSVRQSLNCARVLRPEAWEKQTLRRHYECRVEP